jgi:ABC-type nitrate/sulfonate/bicarbonate transport system, permease component
VAVDSFRAFGDKRRKVVIIGAKSTNVRKKIIGATISITLFLLLWHFSTAAGTELGKLMPGPIAVFQRFIRSFYQPIGKYNIVQHVLFSLSRVLVGFGLGSSFAIVLGIFMGRFAPIRSLFMPIYQIIRPIPPIAWIPLSILWFGLGEVAKWFLIFLSAFNTVLLNVYEGAKNVDEKLIGASRMLGANKYQTMRTIIIPYSVPYIFAGLHTAVSVSWATVVAAEMVRSTEGAGWVIVNAMEINNTIQILTGIVAIGIVGYLLAIIMRKVEEVICRWNRQGR